MSYKEQKELKINNVSFNTKKKLLERRASCTVPSDAKAVILELDKKIHKKRSEYNSSTIEK